MKHHFTAFAFVLLLPIVVFGQQATQYSLFSYNPYAFNPAYAGMDESLSVTAAYRRQWVGIEGAPTSQNLSAHLPFYFIGGGVGLNINNDEIGVSRFTKATLSYAKYLKIGSDARLTIGVAGGLIQQSFDGSTLQTPEGTYSPTQVDDNHNDDFLFMNTRTAVTPTFGVGIYFRKNALQLGLSADNLTEEAFSYDLENGGTTNILTQRHYYIYARYGWDITSSVRLSPIVLAKSDGYEHQTDLSLLFTFNEIIDLGVSYRGYNTNTQDAVVMMVGMQVNRNIRFVYAYDLTLSPLKNTASGSHEVLLQYNLNKPIGAGVPPPIIYNPRSL